MNESMIQFFLLITFPPLVDITILFFSLFIVFLPFVKYIPACLYSFVRREIFARAAQNLS